VSACSACSTSEGPSASKDGKTDAAAQLWECAATSVASPAASEYTACSAGLLRTLQPMFRFRQASFAFSGAFRLDVCADFRPFVLPVVRAISCFYFSAFKHRDSLGSFVRSWPRQLVFLASSRLFFSGTVRVLFSFSQCLQARAALIESSLEIFLSAALRKFSQIPAFPKPVYKDALFRRSVSTIRTPLWTSIR